jgi:hypothetical protein
VDTSALTEGWVRLYPPAVFPTLWDKIDSLIRKKRLMAVDEVLHELEEKQDDLFKWCKARRKKMFVSLGRNP